MGVCEGDLSTEKVFFVDGFFVDVVSSTKECLFVDGLVGD